MKRALLVFVIATLVLVSTGLWLSKSSGILSSFDAINLGIVLCLVGFALFFGYRRLQAARRGEPSEDELSKQLMRRTASLSYFISLYLWVAILFIKDRVSLDTEELLGMGILGMAIVFAAIWVVLNIKGIRHE